MTDVLATDGPSISGIEDLLLERLLVGDPVPVALSSDQYSAVAVHEWGPPATAEWSRSSLRRALLEGRAKEARADLQRYLTFPEGWDGYSGRRFSERLIDVASDLIGIAEHYFEAAGVLPSEITPGPASDGSVDIEIATEGRRVIFTLYPELTKLAIYRRSSEGRELPEPAKLGEASVVEELNWLIS